MVLLSDSITVSSRYARSANLERDAAQLEPLDGYVVTARTLDVVERIVTTAAKGLAGGAWSLTGPYGSGKSSLALLLDATLGAKGDTRETALALIDEVSPEVGVLARQAHQRHDTHESGFHRALVTAQREPLSHTVLRALEAAVLRRYNKIPAKTRFWAAKTLRDALSDMATDDPRRTGPSPAALVEIARCLAEESPLLLVIDEFGKNLEAIRDGGADSDPYLLQQLAEAGQGSGLPIFVITLQHLSFDDCLAGAAGAQRREWAKVQGRFEDIAFVESPTQTRALIGTVFDVQDDQLRPRIFRWAKSEAKNLRSLGIAELADPEVVAASYPLHPLASLVLPELCSRYGQQERTLFSFLAGSDPQSAASFLGEAAIAQRRPLPLLGLDRVYDYFVASGALNASGSGQSSRWIEIASRLRDSYGLSLPQQRLAKAVALLNLVSTSGTVRASKQMLRLVDSNADEILVELEETGIVTYREFADEYRVWHGTDVDIRGLVDAALEQVQHQPFVEILKSVHEPRPMVAARHSSEHDMLRMFSVRYFDGGEVTPLDAFSQFDGEALLLVGDTTEVPRLDSSAANAKPVVAALPNDVTDLKESAYEVAAVLFALEDPGVAEDWVARRELSERLAQSRATFDRATADTFGTNTCKWILLDDDDGLELLPGRGTSALSQACDEMYRSTPAVGNEMLNRTDLTTQGSKARRLLLEGMIERGDEPDLGFTGYGPEMAMYRAFMERTNIHISRQGNATEAFGEPTNESLGVAWDVMQTEFNRAKSRRVNLRDVYAALLLPPVGMKAAVVPVFVTAGLLASADRIALYEHGTFKPVFTPEISERMVRNPGHFDVKHFANTTGARRVVVDALAKRLNIRPARSRRRVANVLAIVGHLVSRVRRLDNYTLRTAHLSEATRTARDALVAAVEPDELLFAALPEALGFRPVRSDAKSYSAAQSYADTVGSVLDELDGCYELLLTDLVGLLLEECAENTRLAVCGQAAALENEVLDPAVRAFVLALANDTVDNDADWMKAIATVVAKKAPAEWVDDDLKRFRSDLSEQVAAFRRLVALHAQCRIDGGGPFDALRVTVTRSDGSEDIRLVSVDNAHRPQIERVLDSALTELATSTGSPQRAHQALLALLGERLLPSQTDADDLEDDRTRFDEGFRSIRYG
ncbi:MAG: hypothetical protein OXH61_14650 [Acidimicrobiaceae bacterium]|nr:hypothetical protein [Acidimicrobiaceae bacterium]